jgi:predicted amidohydrolase YtcJ
MRNQTLTLLFVAAIFCSFWSCKEKQYADKVILGGTIYTMDEKQPVVEAVAIKGDRIIYVGGRKEAEGLVNDSTEVIDLKGATATPGFIEGHGHIMGIGYNEMKLNLATASGFDDIVEQVRQAAASAKPGEWILGEGWHQDKWARKPLSLVHGFPTHKELSEVSPNNPVFLRHASGHAAMANAKAMEIAGVGAISRESKGNVDVAGGEILRDAQGNPTGLFNERAMTLITRHIPENLDQEKALTLALEACARNGITSFHDAGATRESIALFKKFKEEGRLATRLYVMVTGFDRQLVHEYLKRGPEVDPEGRLTYGMATLPMDTVLRTAELALRANFQVCSHAIGDRANKEILDRYEAALKQTSSMGKDHRFRIEHAQHLHPDDIPRFAALKVIPAMQLSTCLQIGHGLLTGWGRNVSRKELTCGRVYSDPGQEL